MYLNRKCTTPFLFFISVVRCVHLLSIAVTERIFYGSNYVPFFSDAFQDTARRMDLADRYINTKAAKYHLRANRVDIALRTISLFVKHSAGFLDTDQETDEGVAVGSNSSGSALDERLRIATSEKLGEMQCSWFELEAGEASERTGVLGRAIKYFSGVVSHFKAYKDDQFDFHT